MFVHSFLYSYCILQYYLPLLSFTVIETVPQPFFVGNPTISLSAVTESVGAVIDGFLTSSPLVYTGVLGMYPVPTVRTIIQWTLLNQIYRAV